MEQRPLRLGDILDDYCPRERRVTNHAVVAMVDDTVKQTRCTTCDSEHPYKGGQAPRRRKKETPSALFKEVLAGKSETDNPTRVDLLESRIHVEAAGDNDVEMVDIEADAAAFAPEPLEEPSVEEMPAMLASADDPVDVDVEEPQPEIEDGPVHRQLIRATLPRIEGQKDERRPTDFTIRQPIGRGGNSHGHNFRGNDRGRSGRGHGNSGNAGFGNNANRGNGHRSHGGFRFAGQRQGQGQGQGRGQGGNFRSGQQQRQGGRKRSR